VKKVYLLAFLLLSVFIAFSQNYSVTQPVNVRSHPSRTAKILYSLQVGDKISVVSIKGKWAELQVGYELKGYVASAYLTPITREMSIKRTAPNSKTLNYSSDNSYAIVILIGLLVLIVCIIWLSSDKRREKRVWRQELRRQYDEKEKVRLEEESERIKALQEEFAQAAKKKEREENNKRDAERLARLQKQREAEERLRLEKERVRKQEELQRQEAIQQAEEQRRQKEKKALEPKKAPRQRASEGAEWKKPVELTKQRRFQERNENILSRFGISFLYHMTHIRNLENILSAGLVSHNEAHRGLNQVDIADNQVNDRRSRLEPVYNKSIHDYVPFYFNPKNPMLFRRKNLQNDILILGVDRSLIYSDKAIFTNGNAASSSTQFFSDINKLEDLNWDCINREYWNDFNDGKRIKCAEVLVYPKVDVSDIKKIYCNNNVTLNYVAKRIRSDQKIDLEINLNLYFGGSISYTQTIQEPLDDLPF
jgi:hypothetical protein